MDRIEVEQHLKKLSRQLARKPTVKIWQACRWRIKGQVLSFEVKGLMFTGTIEIELNNKQDGYNIYMQSRCNHLDRFIQDVDGTDLIEILNNHIEDPMDGTYFEHVKLYARKCCT